MSVQLGLGIAIGAGALLGWLLWALEKAQRKSAETAAAKARDEAAATAKLLSAAQSQIEAAAASIERLRQDANRCSDPAAVRADLDSLSEELSAPGAASGGAVSDVVPSASDLFEGDLE